MIRNERFLDPVVPLAGNLKAELGPTRTIPVHLLAGDSHVTVHAHIYRLPVSQTDYVDYVRAHIPGTKSSVWNDKRGNSAGFKYWREVVEFYEGCGAETASARAFSPAKKEQITRWWLLAQVGLAYQYKQSALTRIKVWLKTFRNAQKEYGTGSNLVDEELCAATSAGEPLMPSLQDKLRQSLAPDLGDTAARRAYDTFEHTILAQVQSIISKAPDEHTRFREISHKLTVYRQKASEEQRTHLRILHAACDTAFTEMYQYLAGELFRQLENQHALNERSIRFNKLVHATHEVLGNMAIVFHPMFGILLSRPQCLAAFVGLAMNREDNKAAEKIAQMILGALHAYTLLMGVQRQPRIQVPHTDGTASATQKHGDQEENREILRILTEGITHGDLLYDRRVGEMTAAECALKYNIPEETVDIKANNALKQIKRRCKQRGITSALDL